MAMPEKVAHEYPGSPPPAFQQEGMSPPAVSSYQSQPMEYKQQPSFNQPGAVPQQQMPGQPRQFQTAVAINNLGMGAAPVDCPACGSRAMTNISHRVGNTNHLWAGITCCLTGLLCFIPYLMTSLKNVQHRCGSCGSLLATWHKSGQVEQHIHA